MWPCCPSLAGSAPLPVWVLAMSAFALCASEAALLDVRPQQLGQRRCCTRQALGRASGPQNSGRLVQESLPGALQVPKDQSSSRVDLPASSGVAVRKLAVVLKYTRGRAPVHPQSLQTRASSLTWPGDSSRPPEVVVDV